MAETEPELLVNTHPPSAGHRTNAVAWVLIGLATAFLGLRVFCRFKRHRGLWWDDWVLIVSWLVLVSSGTILSLYVAAVFIEHDEDTKMGSHDVGLLSTIMGTLFFVAAIWSKTSFAITLTRIAGPKLKIALCAVMVSMNVITCVSVILRWLQCRPTRKIWDSQLEGTCWNRNLILGVTIFSAAYSAFMDFILAAIPWPIIIKLQIRTSEKIGISIAMGMGICAGVTAIVKCTKFQVLRNEDFADDVLELSIWSVAEIATTIMAASIPMLRALLREATGSSGSPGCAIAYLRDKSREAASKVRSSRHISLAESRRSKTGRACSDATSDDRAALSEGAAGGQIMIMKIEEIHVQFADRGPDDGMEPKMERIPRSYSPWV
ncbi:hypothetical protein AAE478_006105 [Parahypoxylon ruwenzoriense]